MENQLSPLLQQLFQPVQPTQFQQTAPNQAITKGSLIMFRYAFWKNDPMPLAIVTDYNPGFRLRGINLHYLTFSYVRTLLNPTTLSQGFSYQNIKNDAYIVGAFRSYKWNGISQVKKFDSQFILKMMAVARSFEPYQVQAIRQSIDQQLQQQYLPKAQETPTENQIPNVNGNQTGNI